MSSIWCEHCRDHYPIDHYGPDGHLAGPEYGWLGQLLAEHARFKAALETIATYGGAMADKARAALGEKP
jgi:hypothetical protein